MFEKEAQYYAFDEVKHKQEWYIKHPERSIDEDYEDIKKHWGKGAEFGYNKCKEEINQKGLALQSDMDKTIEQNIALKKELETANEWHKDLPIEDVILAIIEVEDCGYLLCEYRKGVWYDKGSSAVCKDWITRNIKRWKEIVLPKEIE